AAAPARWLCRLGFHPLATATDPATRADGLHRHVVRAPQPADEAVHRRLPDLHWTAVASHYLTGHYCADRNQRLRHRRAQARTEYLRRLVLLPGRPRRGIDLPAAGDVLRAPQLPALLRP